MAKKVADQIVEMLVNNNVKRIYAVTGDSLNELNDAVRRSGKIKWIHVRHEEVGAYAAAAEAELDGLACCAGSSGPGHVHLINGLYDANRSGIPIIAIASTINTPEFGVDYFQATNTYKLFDDCSVYNEVASTPKQVPRMLQAAIQNAVHRKGVAVFGLPGDVSAMPAEESATSMYNYHSETILRPSDNEMQKFADLVNKYPKVSIYCGIGAREAHDDIVKLAALLKAPIGYSFRGKMGMQHNNPYEVGMTGLLGVPSAFHAMHESDVVILLGTDFPYEHFMPVKNKIIQVDEKPERLGRRAKLEMGLTGKITDTIAALLPLVNEKEDDSFLNAQLDFYKKVKENLNIYVKDEGFENHISPEFVASTINEMANDDTIFTVDTGMCCVWGARYIHGTGERSMLGSFNHGSMANAMPMAIGAQLAYPDRQVVAFCGDGGLSMLLGDLATIKQYNLPIKLIIFNNRSLGMVQLEMQVEGLPNNETDMVNPNFEMIAQAMGFKGISVTKPTDVRRSLEEAFELDGPVLVSVFTNPQALAMPPKMEFDQMKGYTLSISKMILSGRMDEVSEMVKTNYKHIKEVL
ncbi:ubiquinone-dependent pyruvate dehydrogenase [Maribacter polysiphoniae]|uniref:Pyruvate dehydrogenase (Quinone) n=1 Tax=Maribacter polysiphoniae TaxID=429344 RepID=A0A316E1F3_9FLAO|nr:thiamine pyrophosphate-dependent enzyme [Maribacter polysiphoniae]MBD1260952.1 ubiquinone-dependent pyruvate dehydrogenase [Maribacter polysiphoniae]PWK23806.1 pyruvate dehydrogenase (quinone) [Maribacter polysiphoniae]